ncbi:hypothetical protein [Aliarcobacter cryaerophilus]|uniref:hypothetical protein n=1 Tax=Aliarcobacter cryaerophilus TaxID=28198 RepID=UPI00112F3007|nr:hypothetical protein [Aliarcobacter cryaerophilus]
MFNSEELYYIEHRMMFLGHKFTNNGDNASKNFSFNDYETEGGKIVFKYTQGNSDHIIGKINEINKQNGHQLECKDVIYNFLNNGCVSIIISYNIKKDCEYILKNYENIGGKSFDSINKEIAKHIYELVLLDNKDNKFQFIPDTIFDLLEKIKNTTDKESEIDEKFEIDEEYRTDSIIYSQHFIFKEYAKFEEKLKSKDLKKLFQDIKNSEQEFTKIKDLKYKPLKFDWGVRYWEKNNDQVENIEFDFLDKEFLFLSRQVLVNSQIMISTDISKKILFDKDFGKKIEIEDLESFISLYKTFHLINDLMLMDFNEDTKLINSALFKYDDFKELEESKNNSEDTILKILKNYETKRNKNSEIIFGIIIFIIGALTVYSVTHDIFQFMPIDKDAKYPWIRIPIFIVITFMIYFAADAIAQRYKTTLKDEIIKLYDKIINSDKVKNICNCIRIFKNSEK